MSNFLRVISPYKHEGIWVFDEDKYDLIREPFVFGADIILDSLVAEIPTAEQGFNLLFSHKPFPQYQACFQWIKEECDGNWYRETTTEQEGWLCPALLKYFETPPEELYILARKK